MGRAQGVLKDRAPERERARMREVVRTNDLVLLGAITALLDAADIGHLVADAHISALEGSIGILPRRLLVAEEDAARAWRLLADAGFSAALRDPP